MKYGVFGLTADPCTCAHYEIVKKVLEDKIVDKVIVIPTIVDYYRKDKKRMFTNEQRLEIIKRWFDCYENVIIDDYEYKLLNTNPETCVDRRYWHMLQALTSRHGSENEYLTIIGMDSWNNIESWFNFKELGKTTKFIVVGRENQNMNYYINYPEFHSQPHKVVELDEKFENVSASEIRKRLEESCNGMSLGPNGTPFNLYMEEIEDYKNKQDNTTTLDENKDVLLAHTPIFDLVEAPEVEAGFKPVKIKSKDWVSIMVEKDGKFLMTKQLRFGLNKELEEFPCGMIEDNEDVIEAGLRELKEETGIKILDRRSVHYLGKFAANPAFMTNYMHYLHINLDYARFDVIEPSLDEHERLTSYEVDKKTAFENFLKSEGSSIMGCAWMLLMKGNFL